MFSVSGRRILITGAGRGLGRALADSLHEAGATVWGTSRNAEDARNISRRYGTDPLTVEMGDATSISALAGRVSEFGGVDALVNNAGINIPEPALRVTPEHWDAVLNTNVRGCFFLASALAAQWIDRGLPGDIINVSSQAGIVAIEERAAYGASKAALNQLTRGLALEWAAHGIRVNGVAPTFVRTELTATTLADPERARTLLSRIPLGRFGEPGDVTGPVQFLLSPAAAMITGHTLVVDGGYTIH